MIPRALSGPTGYAWEWDKTQHVVFLGEDLHIHELWLKLGSGWRHSDLTVAASAGVDNGGCPVGYAWEADQTQHVVYEDRFEHIHELRFKHGDGWSGHDLTADTHQSVGAGGESLAVYTWDADRTQHVVYPGSGDGSIHELWDAGVGWHHNNLTKAVGLKPVQGISLLSLAAYTWAPDKTEHVIYIGDDGHIHELWLPFRGQWHHNDLTVATGTTANAILPPMTAYGCNFDQTEHVIYVGGWTLQFGLSDLHIQELWLAYAGQWQHRDLTAQAGAPLLGADPVILAAYTWDVDQSQHVVYRTKDGHIHELWLKQGSGWHDNDLTIASGAPADPGGSNPFGYAWNGDLSQHVVYAGSDRHVYELWFKLGSGWHYHDLTALFA